MGKCPGRLRCPREHVGDAVSEEEGQSRHGLDTGRRTGGQGSSQAAVGPTEKAGQGRDVPQRCGLGVHAPGLKGCTHFCPAAGAKMGQFPPFSCLFRPEGSAAGSALCPPCLGLLQSGDVS